MEALRQLDLVTLERDNALERVNAILNIARGVGTSSGIKRPLDDDGGRDSDVKRPRARESWVAQRNIKHEEDYDDDDEDYKSSVGSLERSRVSAAVIRWLEGEE